MSAALHVVQGQTRLTEAQRAAVHGVWRNEFLRTLHPAGFRDMRLFRADKSNDTTLPSSHAADDDFTSVNEVARTAKTLALDAYVGVAARAHVNGRRLGDCAALWCLFAEFDFKTITETEARARLSAFPFQPSAVVASGGGLHVYWLLQQGIDLQVGPERTTGILMALSTRLGADLGSAEPAHVLRLPGTQNFKYSPPRPVVLEFVDVARRYALDDVVATLGHIPVIAPPTPHAPIKHSLGTEERVRMARAWLATQEPAVEGQGGDEHTYSICCAVAMGHDLDEESSFEALRDWNERCDPPWKPKALRKKVQNAIKYATGARGEKLRISRSLSEEIAELNKRFALISVGNKVVVMETRYDGSIKELWPLEEFKRLLIKQRVCIAVKDRRSGQDVEKEVPVADTWLRSEQGRQHDRLVYAMPGSAVQCGPNDYNGWLGFTVKASAGSWALNRDHMLNLICQGKAEYFGWLFNWCAALVQRPGQHAMAAIVLRGGQGIGKGHLAHTTIGGLFGSQQYLHIVGSNQLTAEFNEHLSGKVFVFADESTWGGDPKAASKLKGLVTEDTIPIHRKFLKMVEEPSALHIVIASNNEWPIPIDKDDRRFTVFDVSETRKQDDTYFAALREELQQGGRAALLHDLLAHPVDWSLLRHPLMTDAKRDITTRSLAPIERWWLEKLESGRLDGGDWPEQVMKDSLHGDYIAFLEKHHPSDRTRRATATELGVFFRKVSPAILEQRRLEPGGERSRFWVLPKLSECRREWVRLMKWSEDYSWE